MRKLFFLALTLGAVALSSCDKKANDPEIVGFSINANGGMVTFAPGNLQYQASTHTWQFAANQYDYIGDDNANVASDYDGWVDLFCWGTGNNPTRSAEDADLYTDFVDWGVNEIMNGKKADKAGTWRTLTLDEWKYIFDGRKKATGLRSRATVCGVQGMMLLPDGWVTPDGIRNEPNATYFDTNVFEATDWAKMEANGAVFLPAAGYREMGMVFSTNYEANYWSSTPDESGVDAYDAYCNANDFMANNMTFRWDGCSVRLVKEL